MQPLNQVIALYKENKFFRLALIVGGLFFILTLLLAPKKKTVLAPSPSPIAGATNTDNRPELQGIPEDNLKKSADYRNLISDRLPITLEEFNTSVGITTSLNIYTMKDDPKSTLRFEIYGISYLNKDSTPLSNPNLVAFQESFKKGISLMEERGIDPKQLIFIYGDVEYVRATATEWVNKYNLLPK